jgi:3-hydroxyisobutyrate dehydrogenase-like beta-hydroxyacid dehydrogenase
MSLKVFIAGGTGGVGGMVAAVLVKAGHSAILGSRDPASDKSVEALKKVKEAVGDAHASKVTCEASVPADCPVVISAMPSQKDKATLLEQGENSLLIGYCPFHFFVALHCPFRSCLCLFISLQPLPSRSWASLARSSST